ncbi:MAG: DUF2284 domain-containing protein [Eisenbergiella massiliensis]
MTWRSRCGVWRNSLTVRRRFILGPAAASCVTSAVKRQATRAGIRSRQCSSLEAYGINVSTLAAQCGMRYINGKDTVTYFGAVFFS